MTLPSDRDIRDRGDLRFSEAELKRARDSMLREKINRVLASARAGARGALNREFAAKRGSQRPFDAERLWADREPSPNEEASTVVLVGPDAPDPRPFDLVAEGERHEFSTRSPLAGIGGDDEPGQAVTVSQEVFGNSTVIREFQLAQNPYRGDKRSLGEPARDVRLFPSAGQHVRDAREAKGWTVADLAERSGVAADAIERAERAELPTEADRTAIAAALKLDADREWAL